MEKLSGVVCCMRSKPMQKEEILKRIDETVICLYQNKQKEALNRAKELMTVFEHMAEIRAEQKDGSVLQVIRFLKNFIENYNYIDMIGMADCLQEHARRLVEAYGKE